MAWHHHHFPTFHSIARWYKARDLFERIGINVVAWVGVVVYLYAVFLTPPLSHAPGAYVQIEEGAALRSISQILEDKGVVRNGRLFELITRALGDDTKIQAGLYHFSRQDNMVWVAMRILTGDFETEAIRVTIPEGSTVNDIAKILLDKLPEFDRREFLGGAREGYMFPDTYFFRPGQSTEAILSVFENNFNVKMLKVKPLLAKSEHTLEEALIMASILEKEASKSEDRKRIAGVLWHRIEIGMPLQTDATFPYYLGRNTFQVTLQDLREDHPYNTYTNKGLPPGPIGNPGMDSIMAALQPIESKYVFFLSDRQGNFHYSVTYEGHLANKRKYLD